jgi:hypothetical protein
LGGGGYSGVGAAIAKFVYPVAKRQLGVIVSGRYE